MFYWLMKISYFNNQIIYKVWFTSRVCCFLFCKGTLFCGSPEHWSKAWERHRCALRIPCSLHRVRYEWLLTGCTMGKFWLCESILIRRFANLSRDLFVEPLRAGCRLLRRQSGYFCYDPRNWLYSFKYTSTVLDSLCST